MAAIGVTDPAECVFVGDRPYDDIYGAKSLGMRAVLAPEQHGSRPTTARSRTQSSPASASCCPSSRTGSQLSRTAAAVADGINPRSTCGNTRFRASSATAWEKFLEKVRENLLAIGGIAPLISVRRERPRGRADA